MGSSRPAAPSPFGVSVPDSAFPVLLSARHCSGAAKSAAPARVPNSSGASWLRSPQQGSPPGLLPLSSQPSCHNKQQSRLLVSVQRMLLTPPPQPMLRSCHEGNYVPSWAARRDHCPQGEMTAGQGPRRVAVRGSQGALALAFDHGLAGRNSRTGQVGGSHRWSQLGIKTD